MNALLSLLTKEGMRVSELRRIYDIAHDDPYFVRDAITVMRLLDAEVAWHAAWLVARAATEGAVADGELLEIARAADEQSHWASRALLCQLFSRTSCPVEARSVLFPFLCDCFRQDGEMIRPWAVAAMVRFADDPVYAPEIAAIVAVAKQDQGKAMQARLRQMGLMPYPKRRLTERKRNDRKARPVRRRR